MHKEESYVDKFTDDEFLLSFVDKTYPISEFDHEAHVRLGWVLLKKQPLISAIAAFTKGLKAAAIKHGLDKKYNETVFSSFSPAPLSQAIKVKVSSAIMPSDMPRP